MCKGKNAYIKLRVFLDGRFSSLGIKQKTTVAAEAPHG